MKTVARLGFKPFRLTTALSTGLTAASLLIANPTLGQNTNHKSLSNEQQHLLCVTQGEHLVCSVQQPGQMLKTMIFKQKPYTGKASETIELVPVTRTALFTPELDKTIANGLLWTSYLGLPVSLMVAIWRYDQRTREKMSKLVAQMATLERIWQKSQAQ